jgi:hypothetical protein
MAATGYGSGGPHDSDKLNWFMDEKNDTLHEFIDAVDV